VKKKDGSVTGSRVWVVRSLCPVDSKDEIAGGSGANGVRFLVEKHGRRERKPVQVKNGKQGPGKDVGTTGDFKRLKKDKHEGHWYQSRKVSWNLCYKLRQPTNSQFQRNNRNKKTEADDLK